MRVVVNLTFGITDDWLGAPNVVVLTTFATAKDARLHCFRNTSDSHCHLSCVVGEEQTSAISTECLECVHHFVRSQFARKILEARSNTDAVAHHPASHLLLHVEVFNRCRGNHNALLGIHVGLLEPSHSVLLVGRLLIVVWHEHGNEVGCLLHLVIDVEANGLTFRHATITVACLHGIAHVGVGWSLLDDILVNHFINVGDIGVVLDNLNSRQSCCRWIRPCQRHFAASFRTVGNQVLNSLRVFCIFQVHIRTSGEDAKQSHQA